MPPKQRFKKDEIVAAALNITRKEGISGVTARGLGSVLGSSSRPIFTVFQNMEQVQLETIAAARTVYNGYVARGLSEKPAFKGVGMQYILFAKEEPNLFRLLFMTAGKADIAFDDILPAIDDNSERILASIQEEYGLTRENAFRLYRAMWIFTHGIACLCATNVSYLTGDETSSLLTEVFTGLLIKLKSEEKRNG